MTAPAVLAAQLVRADAALHAHVTIGAALTQQRIVLRLSDHPALSRHVIRLLPARLARDMTDDALAHRELARLTPPRPLSAFRVGPAAAAAKLRAFYAEAQRRSAIPWQVLAAVNYVESDFGRVRQSSVSGAQRADAVHAVHLLREGQRPRPPPGDPRAARFLHAAGGTVDERAALHRYNPSWAYVDAIERYAGRIRRDPQVFLVYYARRLIVRTPQGYRRLTRL
jgi:hypothetical protein